MSGIRVVSVGKALTADVPLDAGVLVLDGVTLVRESTGAVRRLIERNGAVVESPLTTAERWHVMALFGAST